MIRIITRNVRPISGAFKRPRLYFKGHKNVKDATSTVRVRFAPSPTGHLHIGGARTALFNYLYARHTGGVFILRIEDTDRERSKEEYTAAILASMAWLGLEWDEGPLFQSKREGLYQAGIDRLLAEKKAYRCYCSTEELEEKRKLAEANKQKPMYDGTCRDKDLPARDAPYVVRFRSHNSGVTDFLDLIKGRIVFENKELDDLIIRRSDGSPTYNFTVVIDDMDMGVTHVIRGDDHVNNTPRQIQIFEALGYPVPAFAHVPLMLGPDRSRLSKRHGAKSMTEYIDEGYLPEAMVNYLARLGWSHGDQEIFSIAELIEKFDIADVGKSAGVFNPEKLEWLNAHYIKESDPKALAGRLLPFIEARGYGSPDAPWLARAVVTLQERSKTLVEMAEMGGFYFTDEIAYDPKAAAKFLTADVAAPFRALAERFGSVSPWETGAIEAAFAEVIEGLGLTLAKLAQPLRVALTGKTVSPGIFEVIEVIGRDRVIERIGRAVAFIEGNEKK
ncbi:MAG: glutamate--tRNA ligase [Deltaproteobacteria bacterium]|nr:glutamate--tRNA ligase [Candidatus Zymogenaceae bacterium]